MVHRSESELILDNILFRNRNQSYGAYEIRNVYNSHLKTAAFLAFAVFSLAVISPKIIKLLTGETVIPFVAPPTIIEIITDIDIIRPPLPPDPYVKPPQMTTAAFPLFRISDDTTEAEIASQADLINTNPGTVTSDGLLDPESVNPNVGSGSARIESEIMTPFIKVPEPPVFQGDYFAFLRTQIQYPKEASEENIEGKVHLEFVIEKDGSISDLKVIKPLGHGCDEEALRVIKMTSGKWSAPKNNGVAVRFKKYLAISFLMSKKNN